MDGARMAGQTIAGTRVVRHLRWKDQLAMWGRWALSDPRRRMGLRKDTSSMQEPTRGKPPAYQKSVDMKLDPRQVWSATRRPPNVPVEFTSTFSDLHWKLYAVAHHAQRVIELEKSECAALVERLKRQPELAGIAQVCVGSQKLWTPEG
jgi:hypothetical protein